MPPPVLTPWFYFCLCRHALAPGSKIGLIRLTDTTLHGPFVSSTDAQAVLTAILNEEPDHIIGSGVFSVPHTAP